MALLYEKRGKIAQITIDRPRALNSLDPQTFKELSDALISYRDDNDLWAAILTGSGNRAFCVGADIKDMLPMLSDIRNEWWRLPPTILRGLELWKPIIAAVNGHALGGGLELALACDLRIAAEHATFGAPEVNLGIIPGWGATQRLPRAVPYAKAAQMIFFGQRIDAQDIITSLMSGPRPFSELEMVFLGWEKAVLTSLKKIFSSFTVTDGRSRIFI